MSTAANRDNSQHNSQPEGTSGKAPIRVSELGEFIRFDACERRFKLSYNKRSAARKLPFFERLFSPLDPVLQQSGNEAEDAWQEQLREAGYRELAPAETVEIEDGAVGPHRTPWLDFAQVAEDLERGELAYGREILVEGVIGDFPVEGAIDFVLIEWDGQRPKLRLVEGKSSRKDRTYHRIQVACYRMLLRQMLEANPLAMKGHEIDPDEIEIVVARIEEETGQPQDLSELDSIGDALREEDDIDRLLATDGRLQEILDTDLDGVAFQLNGKCESCVFNIHCLTESGRQRRVELLGLPPSTSSTLRSVGLQTIDDVAEIDIEGKVAGELRRRPGFTESLMRIRDRARARRSTLPRGEENPDDYPVVSLRNSGSGQLPAHQQNGSTLVRVYLSVDFDYTENRLGSLSAHVTRSEHELLLPWSGEGSDRRPVAEVREEKRVPVTDREGRITGFRTEDERLLNPGMSKTIVALRGGPWTGMAESDSRDERELIQGFFTDVIEAIREVCGEDESCHLHFYVWSRNEMTRLVEACARADSRLLHHLRQLLGARESLEQLIFSSVGEEIETRFALGWTGRALIVAASLTWFGARFHWRRELKGGEVVDLDRVFTQDLFDFKTQLGLTQNGDWASPDDGRAEKHRFEVRARFFDSLPAPYWRAMWGALPTPHELNDPRLKGALERYARANAELIEAYLAARVEGLRWLEERVTFKNDEIHKEELPIDELPRFDLGVTDVSRASIDVLRLDSHVAASGWIAERLAPVRDRVAAGTTLPVRDVRKVDGNRLAATIDLDDFEADEEIMAANWTQDAFVRLTVRRAEPESSQTLGQLQRGAVTAVIRDIDWDAGTVELDPLFSRETHYVFPSGSADWAADVMDFATIDESPSDYVAGHVERRLVTASGAPAVRWLDPTGPAIPEAPTPDPDAIETLRSVVEQTSDPDGNRPEARQVDAVIDGLSARIQLIQGPPGTGKTATAALAILARILLRHQVGSIVLLGANTHTAVDNLLERIGLVRDEFRRQAGKEGLELPALQLVRVLNDPAGESPADVEIKPSGCITQLNRLTDEAGLAVAGTTSGLLKLAKTLEDRFTFSELIVDEASMMVFPHFLSLATLIPSEGHILLAGDHRQLAPIMAHDWDREDRPPIEIYQPHLSAYEAVSRLSESPEVGEKSLRRSALELTFRLPPRIVDLIAHVYRQDEIELKGLPRDLDEAQGDPDDPWNSVWEADAGLFLVCHSERASRKANPLEVAIIDQICAADGASAPEDVAIITPHRAQRELLRSAVGSGVDIVDTVERLQGGERKAIIVSGTASEPSAIAASVEFILGLNRSNVAFSRVRERLMVVCAATLLDHIPAEIEHYDETMLWKSLRRICSRLVSETTLEGHRVQVLAPATATDA